ncbi:hypothetical protein HRI_002246400 [Hibiscus trionum]|uniref:Uncharacterized protein n=1 Tax=Hibiscus trionum TaxID=183268 RepID=A0A9W7M4R7_HIBTR|nr:hypothetical protein HRI_002245300 [Hibiscus trionum]GMI85771.1 hypothetical protein HRI_002246400 [Hibiscus trionum]
MDPPSPLNLEEYSASSTTIKFNRPVPLLRLCEKGARIGCAITASNKCKPPWWQSLTGWKSMDLKERERCEDREMEGCLVAAKEQCTAPFLDARIALEKREIMNIVVGRMVNAVSMPEESKWGRLGGSEPRVSNCRASQYLGSGAQLQT